MSFFTLGNGEIDSSRGAASFLYMQNFLGFLDPVATAEHGNLPGHRRLILHATRLETRLFPGLLNALHAQLLYARSNP